MRRAMPPEAIPIAFYAPLKSPDHPVPSGDRTIGRLMLRALAAAGFSPECVSTLRTFDRSGDADLQHRLRDQAEAEVERIVRRTPRPRLWFTYHCHYKAPDLLGPEVTRRLGIPYAIAEPSFSEGRRIGPWAGFAEAAAGAIALADRLFWATPRDRPGIEALGRADALVRLAPFVDPGPSPARAVPPHGPVRLLTVAMMRPGDKLASFEALAAGLRCTSVPFVLDVIGDGEAQASVEGLLAGLPVRFHGRCDDPAALRSAYETAELFVWPGVGEGVGMVYLEAQAAGLPCLAEDRPAQASVLCPALPRVPIGEPVAFASILGALAADRRALSALGLACRDHVLAHHSLEAAASVLRIQLRELLGEHD